ncbi:MATE family efflux transporter [Streptomyces sp. NBC_00094]|uniref:MATE family efflux transporter n=1 Tax=Streptomyces sp. NBC_00094 TaxID=2903620 RepID=UPI00225515C6|nr:MATE family efflux transporter [Streptomyces sp. NBC_00094]MCX5391930.1 MATE family efflux transporter [Streptomyces sp. NBC_00094]
MKGHAAESYRHILSTGIPMVLSSAAVMVSQLVITGLIGRIGDGALYLRSVYSPVSFLLIAVTTGLAVTLQVAVARAAGRGEERDTTGHLASVVRAGACAYAVSGAVLLALGGVLADAVHTTPAQRDEFRDFLAAMVVATFLGMLGELCAATLRGLGSAGTAARVTGVTLVVHLGLIAVCGLVLDGGLMVVPAAGAVAAVVEVVLGLRALARLGVFRREQLTRWRPETLPLLRGVGLPVGASYLVLFVVNLLMLRIVARGGEDVVAGFTVGYTLQTAVVVPAVAFGSAVAVLMNQRLGAGDPTGARDVYRRGLHLALGAYGTVTLVLVVAAGPVADALAGGPDVAAAARDFLTVAGPTFGCTGVALMLLTVLEQIGRGLVAIALNVLYFAVLVGVGHVLVESSGDVTRLYWVMCVAAAVAVVTVVPFVGRVVARPGRLLVASGASGASGVGATGATGATGSSGASGATGQEARP